MGQQEEPCRGVLNGMLCLLAITSIIAACIIALAVAISRAATSMDPEYKVAITGVAGLDDLAAGGRRPTLAPVFNLTVHINNARNKLEEACISRFSTAVVSYGDAFLAKGSVPAFCAGEEQESERSATAWGQDVVVPRFLRERLAGELERGEGAVDVQVTTPGQCYMCGDKVLVCKAKIRGGPSPCWPDYVFPRSAPAAGSTG